MLPKLTNLLLLVTLVWVCMTSLPAKDTTLPPGTIQKGSLANEKLILDAGMGVAGYLATKGFTPKRNQPFQAYVVSAPSGKPGSRHWAERWFFTFDGKQVPVTMDFREDGLGAAVWTIRQK